MGSSNTFYIFVERSFVGIRVDIKFKEVFHILIYFCDIEFIVCIMCIEGASLVVLCPLVSVLIYYFFILAVVAINGLTCSDINCNVDTVT